MMILGKAE